MLVAPFFGKYVPLKQFLQCIALNVSYLFNIYSRAWKWNFWHLRGHLMSMSWQTLECFPLAESKWFSLEFLMNSKEDCLSTKSVFLRGVEGGKVTIIFLCQQSNPSNYQKSINLIAVKVHIELPGAWL